jgi:hypothetical protein
MSASARTDVVEKRAHPIAEYLLPVFDRTAWPRVQCRFSRFVQAKT